MTSRPRTVGLAAVAAMTVAAFASACPPHWLAGEGVPGIDGTVRAMIAWDPDGDGPLSEVLVVAGDFDVVGNAVAHNFAVWDGRSWSALGLGLDGAVTSLVTFNGTLVAAGWLRAPDGAAPAGVFAWDGDSWSPVGNRGAGPNGTVTSLAVFAGELIAGGEFTTVGDRVAPAVAAWDGRAWHALGGGLEGTIAHVITYGDELFAAGWFVVGDSPAQLARWDGRAWENDQTPMTDYWGTITAMVVHDGLLFVAGASAFGCPTDEGGVAGAGNLHAWDGELWSYAGGGGWVLAMSSHGDDLVLSEATSSCPSPHGGGGTSYSVGEAWLDGPALALAEFQGTLIAGGDFSFGGLVNEPEIVAASSIVTLDGAPAPMASGGTFASIVAVTELDGALVVGGTANDFSMRVAIWNDAGWETLAELPSLSALASFGGDLVAGQTWFGHGAHSDVLRWDGRAWTQLGGTFFGGVHAFAEYDDELVVGGPFESGSVWLGGVARWDGEAWQPIDAVSSVAPGVSALAVFEGDLIAAGSFTQIGRVEANNIARWDGTAWHAMGAGLTYGADGYAQVNALATWGGLLIAGGFFSSSGDTSVTNVAAWDGNSWQPVGEGLGDADWTSVVWALAANDQGVFAGGDFLHAGDVATPYLARWNGTEWSAPEGGMNGAVTALAMVGGDLVAAGAFGLAGDAVSAHWARWSTACPMGDVDADGDVDAADLSLLLSAWTGSQAGSACGDPSDLDGDCDIDAADLALLLGAWTG